jgi:lysophospholipase L1-like esterase
MGLTACSNSFTASSGLTGLTSLASNAQTGEIVVTPTPMPTAPVATPVPTPAPTATPKPNEVRLMPIGDSITYGYLGESIGGYRGPLYKALKTAGYNVTMVGSQNCGQPVESPMCEGHSGWAANGLEQDIVQKGLIEPSRPDIIMLMIGVNSLNADSSPAGVERALGDLKILIDDLFVRAPNAQMIVSSILATTYNQAVPTYNAGIAPIVEAKRNKGFRITFVDLNPSVPLSAMDDKLHPNITGYNLLAEAWFKTLIPFLK